MSDKYYGCSFSLLYGSAFHHSGLQTLTSPHNRRNITHDCEIGKIDRKHRLICLRHHTPIRTGTTPSNWQHKRSWFLKTNTIEVPFTTHGSSFSTIRIMRMSQRWCVLKEGASSTGDMFIWAFWKASESIWTLKMYQFHCIKNIISNYVILLNCYRILSFNICRWTFNVQSCSIVKNQIWSIRLLRNVYLSNSQTYCIGLFCPHNENNR